MVAPACAEEEGFTAGGGEGGTGASEEKGGGGAGGGAGGVGGEGGSGGDPSKGGSGGEGGSTTNMMTTGGAPAGGGGAGGEGGAGGGNGLDLDDYPLEIEMNGTLASSNALPMDALGFQAEIESANDLDIFNVFLEEGSTLAAEITDGMGGCPPGANMRISIYDPSSNEIANRTGLCPRLDGNVDPDLLEVDEEGTYFIQVSASVPVPFYVLEITAAPPICGDNVLNQGEECDDGNLIDGDGCDADCTETPICGDGSVQIGEECDDGNMNVGDGCDASCGLEGSYCPESEPNNTTADATPITTCIGGFGEIDPIGDQDFFEVTVTVPGSGIRARTTSLNGTGCPTLGSTQFNSIIRLYDASGNPLGSNDSGGTGITPCSLIDPSKDAFARNLNPGTYFLAVEESGNDAISQQYALLINVLEPGCGDGVVQLGEQCDDSNLADGDGCSSTCQVEGNYCSEIEPNNDSGAATALAGCDGAAGAVTPAGDRDYYRVDVTVAGSSIRGEIVDTTGTGCPASADTMLRLYNAAGTQLGSDDDDGNNACSLIGPANDVWTRNLAVGAYYLVVEDLGNNGTIPPYLLKTSVLPPGCGDQIVQSGEQCDDGNVVSGDGCSATCQVEGNYCAESEPNDTFTQSTPITVCDGGTGRINYISDSDWYSFEVTEDGSNVRIEVLDTNGAGCPAGFDSFVRLFNSSMVQLGTDNDDGNASCSLINPLVTADAFATNLPVGTYHIRVEESGNDAVSPAYLVAVDVSPPVCGDTFLQSGEECDDGNNVAGDGCDDICAVEDNFCASVEPNNTTATATSLATCAGGAGRVSPIGDKDFFSFEVTAAGSTVRAYTTSISGVGCGGNDTHVRLYSPAGAELGNDDDDGIDACSDLGPQTDTFARNLMPGIYFVSVEEFSNDATTRDWRLYVDVSAPGCGDGLYDAATEECEDGNTDAGDGCSDLCEVEGNYCEEVEPNNAFGAATSLTGCDGGFGYIGPANGDLDYFSFTVVDAGSTVRIGTTDTLGGCKPGLDTTIRLYNTNGTSELGNDDNDGPENCSLINPATDTFARNLMPGTYFVRVEETGLNANTTDWVLDVEVNPPGCGDYVIAAGEQCDDGNTDPGDGCSAACGLEFECAAGETLVNLTATGLPLVIADNSSPGAVSTINQTTVGTVTRVGVLTNIAHLYTGDVNVSLTAPNNTVIDLSSGNGGSGDNYTGTLFVDSAGTIITSGAPPYAGAFRPEQPLSTLDGTPANGNWTLTARDIAAGVAGELTGYTLFVCVQP